MKSKDIGNKEFERFEPLSLFCPKCKRLVPVIKKLLLILPEGEIYDYICSNCGEIVGGKREKSPNIFR